MKASNVLAKYDPWGPISATLYDSSNSDLVESVIAHTGVPVDWPTLDEKSRYSHTTRIRAYKPAIHAAYKTLSDDEKGRFAQVVVKRLISTIKEHRLEQLQDSLNSIGWTITEDGNLVTQDSLISEQFFPPGTHHDAYVAIRDILAKATQSIVVVDAFMGSSLFTTLSALPSQVASVKLLTTEKNLKPDFSVEATSFRKQFGHVNVEVRTTPDFHDRFILIDGVEWYHVGASIKDAGNRAFLISRLEDAPILAALSQFFDSTWNAAKVVI